MSHIACPLLVFRCRSDTGKCEKEIDKICDEVEQGESRLADCLSDAIAEAENSDSSGEGCRI